MRRNHVCLAGRTKSNEARSRRLSHFRSAPPSYTRANSRRLNVKRFTVAQLRRRHAIWSAGCRSWPNFEIAQNRRSATTRGPLFPLWGLQPGKFTIRTRRPTILFQTKSLEEKPHHQNFNRTLLAGRSSCQVSENIFWREVHRRSATASNLRPEIGSISSTPYTNATSPINQFPLRMAVILPG